MQCPSTPYGGTYILSKNKNYTVPFLRESERERERSFVYYSRTYHMYVAILFFGGFFLEFLEFLAKRGVGLWI